jgi:hypothetical protein
MPDSVEMPAPVSATMRDAASTHWRTVSTAMVEFKIEDLRFQIGETESAESPDGFLRQPEI